MIAWLLVSVGFEVYVNAFASYDTTYGALGTTVAGLVWLWLTNLTLLMGVELDAAIEYRSSEALRPTPGSAQTGRKRLLLDLRRTSAGSIAALVEQLLARAISAVGPLPAVWRT